MKPQTAPFTIVYETPRLIAVNKQAGLEIVPDPRSSRAWTLAGLVESHTGGKVKDIYRIDTNASGLVLFARDPEAYQSLRGQYEADGIKERHIALVSGAVQEDTGVIDRPAEQGKNSGSGGKLVLASFAVTDRFRNFTLLDLEPKHGSWAQIRVHLRVFGHPLAVDREYRSREALFLSEFKQKYKSSGQEHPLIRRITLHAASATFMDPDTKQPVTIEAPLPKDLELTIKMLGKYNR